MAENGEISKEIAANSNESGRKFFTNMKEANRDHWRHIYIKDRIFKNAISDFVIIQLRLLRNDCHGFAIDRLEHCLQTATRAYRDGRDAEYVACALVHDIGAMLAPDTHGPFIAMIMAPYVSEKNQWMLHNHGIFQSYYFAQFFGGDPNARDKFIGHPYFDYTAEFCELYDQTSFDPEYNSMSLAEFEPLLRQVLRPR